MIIKKFQGKTENEATALALKELGKAAVIMNVKTTKPKGFFSFFKPSIVEVTAAVEEETDNPPVKKPEQPKRQRTDISQFAGVLPDDAPEEKPLRPEGGANIEAKLESLTTLIEERLKKDEDGFSAANNGSVNDGSSSAEMLNFIKLIYNTLINNEVDERYANEIINELEKMNRPGTSIDQILSNIYQKMILMFGQANTVTPAANGPKVVFFIGPTGVGKTTTIAKIASSFSIEQKKKVALITTDTYRIAAAEQLKTYANIMGCPFRVIYTEDEIKNAVKSFADYDYIMVDTAGHSPKNTDLKEGTRQFLSAVSADAECEVYLVLSATTKYKDLLAIADTYREMTEYKLIFTKLDETAELGNLWNIKRHTNAEMSYITTGQNVPDDIVVFNPQTAVKQLLGGDK